MSMYNIDVPAPDELNYHEAQQQQRVEAAKRLIDVGDVISIVEDRLAAEGDVTQHPLYGLTLMLMDRAHACDGAKLFDDWKRRIVQALETAIDDALDGLGED